MSELKFFLFLEFFLLIVGYLHTRDQPQVDTLEGLLRSFMSLCLSLGMCGDFLNSPIYVNALVGLPDEEKEKVKRWGEKH